MTCKRNSVVSDNQGWVFFKAQKGYLLNERQNWCGTCKTGECKGAFLAKLAKPSPTILFMVREVLEGFSHTEEKVDKTSNGTMGNVTKELRRVFFLVVV